MTELAVVIDSKIEKEVKNEKIKERFCSSGVFIFIITIIILTIFRFTFGVKISLILRDAESYEKDHPCRQMLDGLYITAVSSFLMPFASVIMSFMWCEQDTRIYLYQKLTKCIEKSFIVVPCWNIFILIVDNLAFWWTVILYVTWMNNYSSSICPDLYNWVFISMIYNIICCIVDFGSCCVGIAIMEE